MAVPVEKIASPLDSVIHLFRQGQEKALKQAFYNTATNFFVLLVCFAAVAVYYILEIFLRPLTWAVLCGTCLFPIKRTLTKTIHSWLSSLHDTSTPLFLGSLFIPIKLIDRLSESLGIFLYSRWKLLISLLIIYLSFYLMIHYVPIKLFISVLLNIFCIVYDTLDYFSSKWVIINIQIQLLLLISRRNVGLVVILYSQKCC